jgi:hypothetical protein
MKEVIGFVERLKEQEFPVVCIFCRHLEPGVETTHCNQKQCEFWDKNFGNNEVRND